MVIFTEIDNGGIDMQGEQVRLMVIGAHPDDCELSAGGLAAKYRSLGRRVKFVYATNGDAGHHEIGGAKLAEIRAEEVRRACAVADIEYQILDIHDGMLEANLSNREKFICLIREFRPDIIITHRTNDYHPDHRNTGILVQDSSYLIGVPNICPQVPCLREQPVILYAHDFFTVPVEFKADIVIDIDDVFDVKTEIAGCHRSQFYEWLPWIDKEFGDIPEAESERAQWLKGKFSKEDEKIAERFRSLLIDKYGPERGSKVKCAEAFQVSEYGGPLTDEKRAIFFPF